MCTRTLHTSPGYTLPCMENSTITAEEQDELVEEELLVEEISIDGMCGVY